MIKHLEAECEYLKSELERCVADYDFDGAKAFQKPFSQTSRKLSVLKSLKNPNSLQIFRLRKSIERMERQLSSENKLPADLDVNAPPNYKKHYLDSIKKRVEFAKIELRKLESIPSSQFIDDDKILTLFEELDNDENNELEFEIIENEIFLKLRLTGRKADLSFKAAKNVKINNYLTRPSKTILSSLGYDLETYSKTIEAFEQFRNEHLLKELSIIYFEVFNVFGKVSKVRKL